MKTILAELRVLERRLANLETVQQHKKAPKKYIVREPEMARTPMDERGLIEYAENIVEENRDQSKRPPHLTVKNVQQAIENALWSGASVIYRRNAE